MFDDIIKVLGKKVDFTRQLYDQDKKDWEVISGSGNVIGVHLNQDLRPMVAVAVDGKRDNVVNVDHVCIGREKGFVKLYKDYTKTIKEISDQGSKEAQSVVDDYNKRIENIHDGMLG